MYLRMTGRPHVAGLLSGEIFTTEDLPSETTRRWTASVQTVTSCLLTAGEARQRYQLSAEELQSWRRAHAAHGPAALRQTTMKRYRRRTPDA